MLIRLLFALTAASLALTAGANAADPPKRIRSVTLKDGEACPKSTGDEVVVCARIPTDEQYRIPKELRNSGPVAVKNQSWAARTDTIDEVSREAGGLPNTCSPVGTGGATGCTQIMIQRAYADKAHGTDKPQ